MRSSITPSLIALAAALAAAPSAAMAQDQGPPAQDQAQSGFALDEIMVTAQRRETGLQDTSVAVAAVTGENLENDNIQSYEDLARSVASLSFTALTPLDNEYNIRGITNTRLDSPSADQSIGIFIDNVYVGRSGLLNTDFFDIERVEVIRGPQGVLLGRNVVGGAISVITREPEFEPGGAIRVGYGNYSSKFISGHWTGPITDTLATRLSVQYRDRDGYNEDILHGRDLDDLKSAQFRGQLLWESDQSDARARLVFDYMNDESNGFHSVGLDDPNLPGQGPWSATRALIDSVREGGLDLREGLPEHPTYKGDLDPTSQGLEREAFGVTLGIDVPVANNNATLSSITGYRDGEAHNIYSQTGLGPDSPFGVANPLTFEFPVNEKEAIVQFSQELRLTSSLGDSPFDWIAGVYFQHDDVKKYDKFWVENLLGLPTLNGESHWDNKANTTSYAAFGQVGYTFNDMFRIVGGLRYSHDKKEGTVTGTAVETGDKFNPDDPVAATPLAATFLEGESFTADYDDSWSELTPQITAEITPTEDLFLYLTYSRGYKGGGFEDDPANAIAAQTSYDPETVNNFEAGAKWDFFDGRARLNLAGFFMEYKDLQVTQTDDGCLCNITDNAADAEILGFEGEFQLQATENLFLFGAVTVLDTEYLEFIDSNGLDASGNKLQRTPEYQYNIGAELTLDAGQWRDALTARVTYAHQGELFWSPENIQKEEAYGLLNANLTLSPPDQPWGVSVWGRNLTDEFHRVNVIPFLGDEMSRLGAPRTYGVELSYQF
ncbi:MAG: TonB-dependent receptor [Euryhalocaulis sp.]|uniref:TonB-dependent receptor n=1 Tax=Euryhalocaulis sp. TaxID=2744307 RepID=UPI001844A2A9|nr:TonB-dependent receptor [Euryhalocaulis sp.]MBA4800464.1 TonB-dependent receptor [Euryhalocaulis sp.]